MIIGYILLAIAIVEIIIGINLLFKYQKSLSTLFFGLFCFSAAIYVGANGVAYAQSSYNALCEAFAWVGGSLATAFFFAFSFSFPHPKKTLAELAPWIIWPIVVFVPSILFTDEIIVHKPEYQIGTVYNNVIGPMFWLFLVMFFVYWGWALVNFIRYYRKSSGYYRMFVRILLTGIVVSLISSSIFDIFLPMFMKSGFGYIGSLLTSVWVIGAGYLMVKK